jgi:hypothetical protein
MDETPAATVTTPRRRLRRFVIPPKLPQPINPALLAHAEASRRDVQNRIADAITRFSGSMTFVYLHIIWFACWIGFGVESYPYGLLTMIVSLEAIFLSTFVMISQNRADAKRQVLADQQWRTVQEEDEQNRQLLEISEQILDLTTAVHAYARAARPGPRGRRAAPWGGTAGTARERPLSATSRAACQGLSRARRTERTAMVMARQTGHDEAPTAASSRSVRGSRARR